MVDLPQGEVLIKIHRHLANMGVPVGHEASLSHRGGLGAVAVELLWLLRAYFTELVHTYPFSDSLGSFMISFSALGPLLVWWTMGQTENPRSGLE